MTRPLLSNRAIAANAEELRAALAWMAREWAKYAEDTEEPNAELVREAVDMALTSASHDLAGQQL